MCMLNLAPIFYTADPFLLNTLSQKGKFPSDCAFNSLYYWRVTAP